MLWALISARTACSRLSATARQPPHLHASLRTSSLVSKSKKASTTPAKPTAEASSTPSTVSLTTAALKSIVAGFKIDPQNLATPLSGLPHLEAVRQAIARPVQGGVPPLSADLDAEVFRARNKTPVGIPHYEVLEWLGDRELNSVAAQVLAVMSPAGLRSPKLAWHSKWFGHLITNKLAARFAAELGLKKRLPLESDDQLADRFEAYIGALWCFRGQQSVISVLAPLFHREIASLDHVGAEKAVRRLATKKTTLPLPSPLIPLSASPVASTKSIAPVKVTKPHAGVAAPTHTLVAGSKAKTPDLAVAIVKVQKSKKTKNTAAASKYSVQRYASLEDAKKRFVSDLQRSGMKKHFVRSKRFITFQPPPARVRLTVGEDSLGLLLTQAAAMGYLEIHGLPAPASAMAAGSEQPAVNSKAKVAATCEQSGPLPLRFSTEAQAIAELRARLSSTGLDEFLTMGGVKVTQAIVGGPVKSPWKLSLPGRKPFEGSFSARQADLGWKGLVKQAIKQGAVVVEKSK